MPTENPEIQHYAVAMENARASIREAVKGLDIEIDAMVTAMFAGGHALIEGPPGTGKTLMAASVATCFGLEHTRVQFTPDLTPTDIIGMTVYERSTEKFRFERGPVFTDVLVADEINRAPAKTQAALLEAMQERRVSVDRVSMDLSPRFFVVATQNPIEMEGTYPLPEAQLDRFMMKIDIPYPDQASENEILRAVRDGARSDILDLSRVRNVLKLEDTDAFRAIARTVKIEDTVLDYIARLVRSSRDFYGVEVGCSPRAGVALLAASRARAACDGRAFVIPDDIKALAVSVLAHRLVLTPDAELEGLRTRAVVEQMLERVEVPR